MGTSENQKAAPSAIAAMMHKKRAIVSYANMSEELAAAFKEKYPHGYSDYCGDITKIDKPDGTSFYAISIEIPSAIYLVKIDVEIDDYEDAEKALDGNTDDDDQTVASDSADNTFPDDDSGAAAVAAEDASDDEN